jgi:uncharacterized membrane protein YhhN
MNKKQLITLWIGLIAFIITGFIYVESYGHDDENLSLWSMISIVLLTILFFLSFRRSTARVDKS